MAIDQIAQLGLSSLKVIYYLEQLFSKFFYIDPEKAILELYKEQVESYEKITQCPLVPIGECDNGYIILMYGEDVIYGVFDECIYKYGKDIESCFDVLINGKEAIEIN
ncbi:SUKH-3 domain-containing protein [Brenneria salicis]|uniref:SUKH-3 domain-containing protein n=1 Tax=Brenneria salicis TaxID=55214 RepID=UPI000DEA8848|nr:hypothetical protein [Brenneria salicis]